MRMPPMLSSATLAICLAWAPAALGAEKFPKAPPGAGLPTLPAPDSVTPHPLNLIYTPITPCRAFSLAAPIQANQTRSFQITGNGDFSAQGGPVAGCGIPTSATAVAISLHANSGKSGYLTAFAQGTTQPQTSTMLVPAGVALTTGSTVALGTSGGLSVFSRYASLVAGDVTGYYEPQIEGMINSGGGIYSGGPRILSAVRNSTGSYTVTIDRDVTYCSPVAQAYSYGYEAHAYAFNNTTISLYVFSRGAGTTTAQDDYVYLTVKC